MAAIETRGLTHRFGRLTALREVDLAVPEGSVYALLGRNGAGKTTLLKILTGELRASGGEASVLGKDVRRLCVEDRQRIGYVAEGLAPPGWMKVRELEDYLAPLYPTWDRGLAEELRQRFGLAPSRQIRTLSRGERMKVAVLVTLAPAPQVLIMDEPFTGMDVITKDEIVRGLLESAGRTKTTVLISSHDIAELEPLAEWVGFLEGGRLLISEPLERLYERFTRVQAMSGAAAGLTSMPTAWHCIERAGRQLRVIVENDHPAADPGAEVRRILPDANEITAEPATLREIFIALAQRVNGTAYQEAQP